MQNLEFDTGLVSFSINGDEGKTISFCPGDLFFMERVEATYAKIQAAHIKAQKMQEVANCDEKKIREYKRQADAEIRTLLDGLFDAPVSDMIAPGRAIYALAGPRPLWFNFMMAVIEACVSAAESADAAEATSIETDVSARLQRLLKKYGKK